MDAEAHGQLKAEAWRTLKAVDHVDAKAADEGRAISAEWRQWRSQVRAVARGELMEIPPEPARYTTLEPLPDRALGGSIPVRLGGKSYGLAPVDALSLVGALAMAVDGETARITLASGDVLELTHQDVSDIGRQLAGKPADEVSG
jgi:hypothetical protein